MLIASDTINPSETKFHSHMGVYGVVMDDAKTKILVMKKKRGPYTGMWDLPGGSIELTELLEEALEREVYEETGCMIGPYRQLEAVSVRYPYKDKETTEQVCMRHMGVLYAMTLFGTPVKGAEWVEIVKLTEDSATPFAARAAELAKKGLV